MENKKYCCNVMEKQVEYHCDIHRNIYDCSDNLIDYSSAFDEYGLIVHDGGSSCVLIKFCPWCGAKLPKSKRILCFNTLQKLGYDFPYSQEIPEEFHTDEWWKKRGL